MENVDGRFRKNTFRKPFSDSSRVQEKSGMFVGPEEDPAKNVHLTIRVPGSIVLNTCSSVLVSQCGKGVKELAFVDRACSGMIRERTSLQVFRFPGNRMEQKPSAPSSNPSGGWLQEKRGNLRFMKKRKNTRGIFDRIKKGHEQVNEPF